MRVVSALWIEACVWFGPRAQTGVHTLLRVTNEVDVVVVGGRIAGCPGVSVRLLESRTSHGSIAPGERVIAGWLTSRLMGSRFDGRAAIMAP